MKSRGFRAAKGVATVLRDDDGTRIKVHFADLPADLPALTVYAVDHYGVVTALGPVAISNGTGALNVITPLARFMLVASPEAALTAYDSNTRVFFRSTVPEGFAVIPLRESVGERVSATAAPTGTTARIPSYTVTMLDIPAYKAGRLISVRADFTGPLTGADAHVLIRPRKDAPTEVHINFSKLKEASAGQKFILWVVSSDNQFFKIGPIENAPGRNNAQIKFETTLSDFGLLITLEDDDVAAPHGPAVARIYSVRS